MLYNVLSLSLTKRPNKLESLSLASLLAQANVCWQGKKPTIEGNTLALFAKLERLVRDNHYSSFGLSLMTRPNKLVFVPSMVIPKLEYIPVLLTNITLGFPWTNALAFSEVSNVLQQ
jgi:hypothetical protein